jgi:hypothetical protein
MCVHPYDRKDQRAALLQCGSTVARSRISARSAACMRVGADGVALAGAAGGQLPRNRAECQSVSLVLTGIGGSRRDGDAVFQLLLSMAPYSFISLDLSDGPMNLGVPLHHRSAALFELNGSRRNYRNSFITTTPIGCTPNSTASWDRRLLAPRFNGPGAPPSLFHRAIASGSISSSRFVVSLAIQVIWVAQHQLRIKLMKST